MNSSRNSTSLADNSMNILEMTEETICYITLAINGICIIGMLNKPGKLTMRNRLVVSLCASDSMAAVPEVCFTNAFRFVAHPHCCFLAFCVALSTAAHLLLLGNMAALALAYFVAIVKPLKYANFTGGRGSWISILCIWILSSMLGFMDFPIHVIFPGNMDKHNASSCQAVMEYPSHFTTGVNLLASAFVLVMYVFIYVKLFAVLCQRRNPQFSAHSTIKRSLRKGLLTTFLILFTFLFLYLPYDIYLYIYLLGDGSPSPSVMTALRAAQKLNYISDPLIFAARDEDVICGLRTLFHCDRPNVKSISDEEERRSCTRCRKSKSRHKIRTKTVRSLAKEDLKVQPQTRI